MTKDRAPWIGYVLLAAVLGIVLAGCAGAPSSRQQQFAQVPGRPAHRRRIYELSRLKLLKV